MSKQERKQQTRLIQDAILAALGAVLLFVSGSIPHLEAGLIMFMLGVAIGLFGAVDLGLVSMRVEQEEKKLLADQKGVAWILAVAVLSICFMPVVYWIVGAPYDFLVNYITGVYTFTGTTASALVLVRLLISYLLAFFLVGVTAWAIINAKAEQYS
jgi:thiamine transporter ThiT